MQPRPYQSEAMEALHIHLCNSPSNPCIVLPTGSGKTPCMAWVIQKYMEEYPYLRVLVLAHVRELLVQGVEKMRAIWPLAPVGVYSAGLKSKEKSASITYASIQSIWRKAADFEPWDLIFVDEAHRIPLGGETMYRDFLKLARMCNPKLRVVGWTATPYRLDGGPICHADYILNEVIYEANVADLITQGYLCALRSKGGKATADVSGVKIRQGDFVTADVERIVNTDSMVGAAVAEALTMIEGRRAALFFCATVAHAHHVSETLLSHGITAPVVSAETPSDERTETIAGFTAGRYRALCNVNVLSEGFDAQRIDAVVMLRPTASPGLYYQQVGRGLRTHPDKTDCMVCDFAGNIRRHGPVDAVEGGDTRLDDCPVCQEIFPHPLRKCPGCGWFPAVECPECLTQNHEDNERCESCDYLLKGKNCKHEDCGARNVPAARLCVNCGRSFSAEPREVKHSTKPDHVSILSSEPWEEFVTGATVARHEKDGKPPSLRVTYTCGLNSYREWICLEHDGYAGAKAARWWERRFGKPVPATVADAMTDMFLGHKIAELTHTIRVKQAGKYQEIMDVKLKSEGSHAFAH